MEGWVCPKCGKCLSPWVKECDHCPSSVVHVIPYCPFVPYYPLWYPLWYTPTPTWGVPWVPSPQPYTGDPLTPTTITIYND